MLRMFERHENIKLEEISIFSKMIRTEIESLVLLHEKILLNSSDQQSLMSNTFNLMTGHVLCAMALIRQFYKIIDSYSPREKNAQELERVFSCCKKTEEDINQLRQLFEEGNKQDKISLRVAALSETLRSIYSVTHNKLLKKPTIELQKMTLIEKETTTIEQKMLSYLNLISSVCTSFSLQSNCYTLYDSNILETETENKIVRHR